MDLAEMMKTIMAKEAGLGGSSGTAASVGSSGVGSAGMSPAALAASMSNVASSQHPGSGTQGTQSSATTFGPGFITEKMYMIIQLFIQNKGWNSVELMQCFTDLKECSMIPNPAAYFQMVTNRLVLDTQGRLVHRENGKLILPFEHFPNAVMIKHMNGPHGLHLSVEGTIRGLAETYTVGREYFGVDKDYVNEIIQNCPHPPCRFYKNQLPTYHSLPDSGDSSSKSSKGLKDLLPGSQRQHQDYKSSTRGQIPQSLADAASLLRANTPASFSKSSSGSDFSQMNLSLPSLLGQPSSGNAGSGGTNSSTSQNGSSSGHHHSQHHSQHHQLLNQHHHQGLDRETTAQLLKNNLSLDLSNQAVGDLKTVNAMLELSRAKAAAVAAANMPSRSSTPAPTRAQLLSAAVVAQQHQLLAEKVVRNLQQEKLQQQQQQQQHLQQLQQQQHQIQQQQQLQQQQIQQQQIQLQIQQLQQQQQIQQQQQQQQQKLLQQKLLDQQQLSLPAVSDHKLADFLRANLETLDSLSGSNKDLLALHNGAWSSHDDISSYKRSSNMEVGQEKIVRAFQEIMKNMHRMKMCVRPSMCKPYGKQSEMLQKTLEDTLLLVQALRSLLPPPQY